MTILADTIIARNSNIPTIDLDGEVAMMNTEQGKYYGFDAIASSIWDHLHEPKTFSLLIESLLTEYQVDQSTCEEDVREFLNKLNDAGLISIGV